MKNTKRYKMRNISVVVPRVHSLLLVPLSLVEGRQYCRAVQTRNSYSQNEKVLPAVRHYGFLTYC